VQPIDVHDVDGVSSPDPLMNPSAQVEAEEPARAGEPAGDQPPDTPAALADDGTGDAEAVGDAQAAGHAAAQDAMADQADAVGPPALDEVCAAAVDLARSAAQDVAAGSAEVGEHLGVEVEGDLLVTHSFACLSAGYRGWRWAVTLARAPQGPAATVCEVVLLPSSEAILAPAWVPWSDRIAPGDLGRSDVLPYRADDPNLEPGYAATGDDDADQVAIWELGLGRVRVLSGRGREAAARRWYNGSHGPTAESALAARAACASCGYFVAVAGALRSVFGICANEWSPSDGQVVSLDHGCGAHSETDVERAEPEPLPPPVLDETGAEAVVVRRAPVEAAPAQEAPVEAVPAVERPVEEETVAQEIPAEEPADVETPAEEIATEDIPAEAQADADASAAEPEEPSPEATPPP
jgi:hypothetical protein